MAPTQEQLRFLRALKHRSIERLFRRPAEDFRWATQLRCSTNGWVTWRQGTNLHEKWWILNAAGEAVVEKNYR